MVPKIVEGRRTLVSGVTEQTVIFIQGHNDVPYVSVTLEPSGPESVTTARVTSVTKTQAIVQFSSAFSGYLHLHAFSAA